MQDGKEYKRVLLEVKLQEEFKAECYKQREKMIDILEMLVKKWLEEVQK